MVKGPIEAFLEAAEAAKTRDDAMVTIAWFGTPSGTVTTTLAELKRDYTAWKIY